MNKQDQIILVGGLLCHAWNESCSEPPLADVWSYRTSWYHHNRTNVTDSDGIIANTWLWIAGQPWSPTTVVDESVIMVGAYEHANNTYGGRHAFDVALDIDDHMMIVGGMEAATPWTMRSQVCSMGQYIRYTTTTSNSNSNARTPSCVSCAAGRYSTTLGVTSCVTCDNGTMSTMGASSCSSCVAGRYSHRALIFQHTNAGITLTCVACDAGSYRSTDGGTTCTQCDAATYAPTTGMTTCVACPIHASSATTMGSTACTCDNDAYTWDATSLSCILRSTPV